MRLSLARKNLSRLLQHSSVSPAVFTCLFRFLDLASLKTLERYSHFHPSPLTIQQFMEFGKTAKEKNSAIFLRKELPLRLAIITKEMDLLPQKLLDTPSIFSLQVLITLSREMLLSIVFRSFSVAVLSNFFPLTQRNWTRMHCENSAALLRR